MDLKEIEQFEWQYTYIEDAIKELKKKGQLTPDNLKTELETIKSGLQEEIAFLQGAVDEIETIEFS